MRFVDAEDKELWQAKRADIFRAKKCWQAYMEMVDVFKHNGLEILDDIEDTGIEKYLDDEYGKDVMDFVLEHYDRIF